MTTTCSAISGQCGELPTAAQRLSPRYELIGPSAAPVVVVLGGISASRHVTSNQSDPSPGWWSEVVGPDKAVDSTALSVLSIDWVTVPGRTVTTFDQADALVAVLDHLGVQHVKAIIGASYGGMVALAFAARYPTRLGKLILLAAAHRTHPMATANRVIQRRVVQLGLLAGVPASGLALARALGITTYRSAGEFAQRFETAPRWKQKLPRFEVEDYLDHGGRKFAEGFDAQRYLDLSESLDLHFVDPKSVSVPTTLLGIIEDQLVPTWLLRELRDGYGGSCRLQEISSCYGHDAFLKEVDAVSALLRSTLEEEVPCATL